MLCAKHFPQIVSFNIHLSELACKSEPVVLAVESNLGWFERNYQTVQSFTSRTIKPLLRFSRQAHHLKSYLWTTLVRQPLLFWKVAISCNTNVLKTRHWRPPLALPTCHYSYPWNSILLPPPGEQPLVSCSSGSDAWHPSYEGGRESKKLASYSESTPEAKGEATCWTTKRNDYIPTVIIPIFQTRKLR